MAQVVQLGLCFLEFLVGQLPQAFL
jgi:hypothetical protein